MADSAGFSICFGMEAFYLTDEKNSGSSTRSKVEPRPKQKQAKPPTPTDTKATGLSSLAREMQQTARKEVYQRQQLTSQDSDEERLHLLESATAANSKQAEVKDKESLELLQRCQKRINKHKKSSMTPPKHSSWTEVKHFRDMNGTPVSFEPSSSTPSDVRKIYEKETGNEFEIFLEKESRRRKSKEFSAKSKSATSLTSSSNSKSKLISDKSAADLRTTHSIWETLNKRDREEEDKREEERRQKQMFLDRELAEAMDSPVKSPTSAIKHLPRSSSKADVEEGIITIGYASPSRPKKGGTVQKPEGGEGATKEKDGGGERDGDEWEFV